MHSTLLTCNAPAGTSAPWSFWHKERAIEKKIGLSYGSMMMMMIVAMVVVALEVGLCGMRDITIISNKQTQ